MSTPRTFVAPHNRLSNSALSVLVSACLWLISGCMLNQVDGDVIDTTSDSISFAGYTTTANQPVELQFGLGSTWSVVDQTTTTPTRSLVSEDGVDLFGWTLPTALPTRAWTPGVTGSFAKVRMRVPGAGASGSDAFMYTFRSDWSSCLGDHPGVGDFVSHCRSPRSPVAYVFTRDYPRGVDLVVTNVLWTSLGRTEVRVRNGGRTGKVKNITCTRFGAEAILNVDDVLQPGETRTYFSALAPTGRVGCTAIGTNEDGSAESNTSNNFRSNSF